MGKSFPLPSEYYPFENVGGNRNAYLFRTLRKVEYTVIFKSSPYVFGEDKPYASLLFEFSLLVQTANTDFRQRDDLIGPTVAAIFLDFYNRNDQNVCFYICDSFDGKQRVRARKFTAWFNAYNSNERFYKEDDEIKDVNGVVYPVSIILAKDNDYFDEIEAAFKKLISGYNNEK